ncbi:fimbria/pilus periplasmic chaperone [Serratia nematodiphila]
MSILASALFVNAVAFAFAASGQQSRMNTKVFRLKLGSSRVIYRPEAGSATISVSNAQDYPILVQGKIYGEDRKSVAPFIVTPPLSRLEAKQQSRLRIIQTGGQMADDRETLQWLCVAGIPPKDTDVWSEDERGRQATPSAVNVNLEVSAHECVKLLVRPSGVKGTSMGSASALRWQREGGKLRVTNPSPFYMNFASITVGGKEVPGIAYVAPGASRSVELPAGTAGQVQWKILTDEGGESHAFEAGLQ